MKTTAKSRRLTPYQWMKKYVTDSLKKSQHFANQKEKGVNLHGVKVLWVEDNEIYAECRWFDGMTSVVGVSTVDREVRVLRYPERSVS